MIDSAVIDLPQPDSPSSANVSPRSDVEATPSTGAHGAGAAGPRCGLQILSRSAAVCGMRLSVAVAARGSNASRTASANRLAASTSASMNTKADSSDHHTIGSRASSSRAPLIMLPKLIIDGSTPTPT